MDQGTDTLSASGSEGAVGDGVGTSLAGLGRWAKRRPVLQDSQK